MKDEFTDIALRYDDEDCNNQAFILLTIGVIILFALTFGVLIYNFMEDRILIVDKIQSEQFEITYFNGSTTNSRINLRNLQTNEMSEIYLGKYCNNATLKIRVGAVINTDVEYHHTKADETLRSEIIRSKLHDTFCY